MDELNTIERLIEESVEFSAINYRIKMGTINESYVIDEICTKEELNKYIYDAILYLHCTNKERLLKNLDKVINNALGLRLFIANLLRKSPVEGIGPKELKIITEKVISTNDSLNIYIYGEFIRDNKFISSYDKLDMIKILAKGIGKTNIYNHQEEFIKKIINSLDTNKEKKLEFINDIVDGILNSDNLSLLSEFIYTFNRDELGIYKDIDKYKVYSKIVDITLNSNNRRAMVNLSYLDFNNDNLNVLGNIILNSQDLFFIYCFTRKFILFNEDLQEKYVNYLTLHVNDYEELKENLESFLKNPHQDNKRIFKKY